MGDRRDILKVEVKKEELDDFFGLRLISLNIYPETLPVLRKVLKPGIFYFAEELTGKSKQGRIMEVRLYGKNISVQSIVGMNGSGKSSLLDIIYRMINNFCYYLNKNAYHTEAATRLAYVRGLYVDLRYEVDGNICNLRCRDRALALETPKVNYVVGNTVEKEWEGYTDVTGAKTEKVIEVMKWFFYSIVTNFSFNSYLSSDYADEPAYGLQGTSWIDSLFHKNDGYRVPLVLNPYRGEGNLNVQRETNFAVSRTIAILEQFRERKWQFIDGYRLEKVDYKYSPHTFLAKFRKLLSEKEKKSLEELAEKKGLDKEREVYEGMVKLWWKKAFQDEHSYASELCNAHEVTVDVNDNLQLMAGAYIVYKTLSIVETYPVYYDYSKYGSLKNCFADTGEEIGGQVFYPIDPFKDLVEALNKDKSHITYKLRLTKKFLKRCHEVSFGKDIVKEGFELKEYFTFVGLKKEAGSVERMMEEFPPTFFKATIWLKKVDEKGKNIESEDSVPFTSLSSGEKLFIYTISTLIYHILNIKSVSTHRVHYRRINIIMDELELCFHPEMQRTFVDKMVSTITRLHLNTRLKVNLMLVTHSPFILSDIPKQNILYLEKGVCVNDQIEINPYAANVNDILHQSFFLKDSFIGELALKRIQKLMDEIDSYGKQKSYRKEEELLQEINMIGDRFLKQQLTSYLSFRANANKYGKNSDR